MAGNITASTIYKDICEGKPLSLAGQASSETLAGNLTIDSTYGCLIRLDPGGAGRDVTLPAEEAGAAYLIINAADANEDLDVKKDDGGAVVTVGQNTACLIVCLAGTWIPAVKFTTVLT
jgi:hypothetical protein